MSFPINRQSSVEIKRPTTPWSTSFPRLIKQITSPKLSYNERNELIQDISPSIRVETFTYRKPEDTEKGLKALIDIGEYLLLHVDGVLVRDRSSYFSNILFTMKRREFDIQSFAHNLDMIPTCNKKILAHLQRFRNFVYKVQVFINHALNKKAGFYSSLLSFCSAASAFNYFINGQLAGKILQAVWSYELEETNAILFPEVAMMIQALISEESEEKQQDEEFQHTRGAPFSRSAAVFCVMKWEMADMPNDDDFILLKEKSVGGTDWLELFSAKEEFFEQFLVDFGEHVLYLTHHQPNWNLVPGFYQLIHPIILEIYKEAPALSKRSQLLAKILLANSRILNILLEICLKKTNVFNVSQTSNTIKMISDWFNHVIGIHNINHLPDFINYDLLFHALETLLESEHYFILTTTLHFFYRSVHILPRPQRRRAISLFLEHFNRFFFHWNEDIRILFCYSIIFKVSLVEVKSSSLNNNAGILLEDRENSAFINLQIEKLKAQIANPSSTTPYFPPPLQVYASPALFTYNKVYDQFLEWRNSEEVYSKEGKVAYPGFVTHSLPDAG